MNRLVIASGFRSQQETHPSERNLKEDARVEGDDLLALHFLAGLSGQLLLDHPVLKLVSRELAQTVVSVLLVSTYASIPKMTHSHPEFAQEVNLGAAPGDSIDQPLLHSI